MILSPRFRRGLPATEAGTSIIAALVFAAILGSIAIGLNTWQSDSVNTSALSADAAVTQTPGLSQICQNGLDFDDALPIKSTIPVVNANVTISPLSGSPVTVCLSDTAATAKIQDEYQNQPQNEPANITMRPQQTSRVSCNAGSESTTSTGNVCTYKKQPDNTYKLSTPWICRVRIYDPSIPSGNDRCKLYYSKPGESTNTNTLLQTPAPSGPPTDNPEITTNIAPSVPPAVCVPGTYDSYACTESTYCQQYPGQPGCGGTPPSDTANPTSAGATSDCTGGAFDGGYACTGVTPQQAQVELQQANLGSYSCAADPNSPSDSVLCTPSSIIQTPTLQPGTQCPAGEVGTPPNCTPSTTIPAPPTTSVPIPRPGPGSSSGLGGLTSFLSGLARGLSPCATTGAQSQYVGGNGTTLVPVQTLNPQTGQVTTVYVQQQTATNPYGTYGASPCAPNGQQAPYGTGNNGAACPIPPTQPQCAAGATAEPISSSGNGCVTSYQCVPISGSTITSTPTPSLSCSPQVADVGQSVAISYSCANATGSSASGFSTNNQTSGTASVAIPAPPSGTNTANFGLTCTNNGQKASTQCSVQVNQPAIDLVADPQSVPSGQTTSIGWVTAGMKSCVISSPDDSKFTSANANSTNVNGVAQTNAITGNTEFDLTCTTLGGQTKTAKTTVSVGTGGGSSSVTVSSTVDGKSVNHGGTVKITWSDSNTANASTTAAAIWLVDINTEQATALIADGQSTSGTYTWNVPAVGSTCDPTTYAPCASDLIAGDSYGLEVAFYTPQNAFIGPASSAPTNSVTPTYSDYGYTANPFTVGQ